MSCSGTQDVSSERNEGFNARSSFVSIATITLFYQNKNKKTFFTREMIFEMQTSRVLKQDSFTTFSYSFYRIRSQVVHLKGAGLHLPVGIFKKQQNYFNGQVQKLPRQQTFSRLSCGHPAG